MLEREKSGDRELGVTRRTCVESYMYIEPSSPRLGLGLVSNLNHYIFYYTALVAGAYSL